MPEHERSPGVTTPGRRGPPAPRLAALYILKPNFSVVPDMADGEGQGSSDRREPVHASHEDQEEGGLERRRAGDRKDLASTRCGRYIDPRNEVASRSGWDSIGSVKSTSKDGKTVPRHLQDSRTHPGRSCCREPALPAARAAGDGLQHGLERELQQPEDGQGDGERSLHPLELHEGPVHHDGAEPALVGARTSRTWTRSTFVFRTNTDTEIQAIRGGEVDVIYPQPQLQLADLKGQSGTQGRVERGHDARAHRLQRSAQGRHAAAARPVVPAGDLLLDRTARRW